MTKSLHIIEAHPGSVLSKQPLAAPQPWLTVMVLVASDLVALLVAGFVSLGMSLWFKEVDLGFFFSLWPLLGMFVLSYLVRGLYPSIAISPASELRSLTLATSQVYLAVGAVLFLFQISNIASRSVFLLAWILSLAMVPLSRSLVRWRLAASPWWGHPVVLLGAGEMGELVLQTLMQQPMLGLKPVAVLDPDPTQRDELLGIPVVGRLELASTLARQLDTPYAIVAMPQIPRAELLDIVERHGQSFHHLLLIPDLLGFSSLWVEAKELGGILGLEVQQRLLSRRSLTIKRTVDLVSTGLGVILISPVLALIALCVKLDSRGPLLFAQERMGKDDTRFAAFKFRTMCVDAEARLKELLEQDPAARAEYEQFHKLKDDPRVTRVGRILRKFSLDELPQLFNVLRGEMSLVGPRAYIPRELPDMEGHERTILKVVPGITGLWQVSGRNKLSFHDRLRLDIYYVRNWSTWLDIHILARTVYVVLTGHGSH